MDELQKLYNLLVEEGYYTKSFEDFQSRYDDDGYRDQVYDVLSRDQFYTKSRDEFEQKYLPLKKRRCYAAGLPLGGFYGAYLRYSSASSTTEWRFGFTRQSGR